MEPSTPTAEVIKDEASNVRNRTAFLKHIFIVRLTNAWWLATFFQPDEYFQALEPAWNLAFGDRSGAWLTWVCSTDIFVVFYMFIWLFSLSVLMSHKFSMAFSVVAMQSS